MTYQFARHAGEGTIGAAIMGFAHMLITMVVSGIQPEVTSDIFRWRMSKVRTIVTLGNHKQIMPK
jgi:hypothetical protein